MKSYGTPLPFPLPKDGDWVRIQCGTEGDVNYIFGLDGLNAFYDAGAGIYYRDGEGKPRNSLAWWVAWYQDALAERKRLFGLIEEIKPLLVKAYDKLYPTDDDGYGNPDRSV